jgi:hypothetical protein
VTESLQDLDLQHVDRVQVRASGIDQPPQRLVVFGQFCVTAYLEKGEDSLEKINAWQVLDRRNVSVFCQSSEKGVGLETSKGVIQHRDLVENQSMKEKAYSHARKTQACIPFAMACLQKASTGLSRTQLYSSLVWV